jgi:hypothetical protein
MLMDLAILDRPAVWHALNVAHRPRAGRSAAVLAALTGVDWPTLLALTTAGRPLLAWCQLWQPRQPAPAPTGPDQLATVAVATTDGGDDWVTVTPENVVLQHVARNGGRAHASLVFGELVATQYGRHTDRTRPRLDELAADVLARLVDAQLAVVHHLAQPTRPLTPAEITPGVLVRPAAVTVTLTPGGSRTAAIRP